MRKKIAHQLIFVGVSIAIVSGLVLSSVEIILDYQEQWQRNEVLVQSTLEVASPGAQQAAFELSESDAQVALQTLTIYDFFSAVRIIDENGETLSAISREFEPGITSAITGIIADATSEYSVILFSDDANMKVGELKATVHNATIWRDFYSRAVREILGGVLRSLILVAILLFAFHVMLTRPIRGLVSNLQKVDPRNPEPFKVPTRIADAHNELTTLATSTNDLLSANRDYLLEVEDAHKRNEEISDRLHHTERLSIIGKLVGGVAHDFNNILAVIRGNFELLQMIKGSYEDNSETISDGIEAADRGVEITAQLLSFSRRQPLKPEPVCVKDFFCTLESLTKRALGQSYVFEFTLVGTPGHCLADARQLETAILNLAINARDAMPDGGTLTIKAQNTHLNQAYCAAYDDLKPGEYVCFTVADNGTGMPPEVIENAVEPYYTTKEIGKGSGLGLSMVYGFVKQSSGHIKIFSEEGQGTTVELYLPFVLTAGSNPPEKPLNSDCDSSKLAGYNLLVVEDDEGLAKVLKVQLGSFGIKPVMAGDSATALLAAKSAQKLDGALIDVVLPGQMNGLEFADELLRERPALPVGFMSGFTNDTFVYGTDLAERKDLLTKPFTVTELNHFLNELLATGSANTPGHD